MTKPTISGAFNFIVWAFLLPFPVIATLIWLLSEAWAKPLSQDDAEW